jgi:beta-mannosidase
MTACGSYPTHPEFLDSVKEEAEEQVKRLRNHPSIVLWCGNNEDVMIAQDLGLKWDPNNVTGPWDDTDLPQLVIYLKIWAEVVEKLAPEVPYWPSSPFSFGGKLANDQTTGDIHQWNGR